MFLEINDFDNALKCLDNVDDEEWLDSAYSDKSKIYQQLGKYDFIMQKCNECLKKDSNNSLALKLKADCLTSLKKYDEAIKCLDKLIEITSDDNSKIFSKIRILLKLKKYDEVKCILSEIKPQKDYHYSSLSNFYLEINEYGKALKYLNKYAEKTPSILVAEFYLKLDKPEIALDRCNKALKNNPDDYYALCCKGSYYEYIDNFDKALEFYNKAISIDKYSDYAQFKKINLLLKLEKYSEANRVLSNMIHENSFSYWNRLSKYYIKLNDYDKALECIDKTINLNYNIEYLVEKAEILYELERFDETNQMCMDASKLNPNYNKLIEIKNKIKML